MYCTSLYGGGGGISLRMLHAALLFIVTALPIAGFRQSYGDKYRIFYAQSFAVATLNCLPAAQGSVRILQSIRTLLTRLRAQSIAWMNCTEHTSSSSSSLSSPCCSWRLRCCLIVFDQLHIISSQSLFVKFYPENQAVNVMMYSHIMKR